MAGKKSKTSYTFAVTISDGGGLNIPTLREFIRDALRSEQNAAGPSDPIKAINLDDVKIHLTNKETKYA